MYSTSDEEFVQKSKKSQRAVKPFLAIICWFQIFSLWEYLFFISPSPKKPSQFYPQTLHVDKINFAVLWCCLLSCHICLFHVFCWDWHQSALLIQAEDHHLVHRLIDPQVSVLSCTDIPDRLIQADTMKLFVCCDRRPCDGISNRDKILIINFIVNE